VDAADADAELGSLLGAVLARLAPREAMVLRLRHGVGEARPRTLEEIGVRLGVTRERVRQLEASALRKLRLPPLARMLQHHDSASPGERGARSDDGRDRASGSGRLGPDRVDGARPGRRSGVGSGPGMPG
jgi:hypothetical protein